MTEKKVVKYCLFNYHILVKLRGINLKKIFHTIPDVSMATKARRTGGCVHVWGTFYPSKEKKETLVLWDFCRFKTLCTMRGNDVMDRCVLARGGYTAPLLFVFEAMNDEISVRRGGQQVGHRYTTWGQNIASCPAPQESNRLPGTENTRRRNTQNTQTLYMLMTWILLRNTQAYISHTHEVNELECSCLQQQITGCRW